MQNIWIYEMVATVGFVLGYAAYALIRLVLSGESLTEDAR